MKKTFIFLVALAGLVLAGGPSPADQTDARLEGLFARLKATTDPLEARAIERLIWSVWTESGDKSLDSEVARGIAKMEEGDGPAALEVFERVVVRAPNYAEGWNKRATLYYFLGRYEESIRDVDRTLKLEPRHFGALAGLGLIYLETGQQAKAAEWMEKALAVNPHLWGVQEKLKTLRKQGYGKPI